MRVGLLFSEAMVELLRVWLLVAVLLIVEWDEMERMDWALRLTVLSVVVVIDWIRVKDLLMD